MTLAEASRTPFSVDLSRFSMGNMIACGNHMRSLHSSCDTFTQAADAIVNLLHESLRDAAGRQASVLTRLFKTHPYEKLSPALQGVAKEALGRAQPAPSLRCLTLLATRGAIDAFNDPGRSQGHRAIPLPDVEFVRQAPMISRLIGQFGLSPEQIVAPDPELMREAALMQFNVFHVAEACGSPYVPAQDFVAAYGVRSVLGFGGSFPSGNVFTVILFLREAVTVDTADLFKPLALSAKAFLLDYAEDEVFQT